MANVGKQPLSEANVLGPWPDTTTVKAAKEKCWSSYVAWG